MGNYVYESVKEEFEQWKGQGLSLNMARGKPSLEQLELSRGLLNVLDFDDCVADGRAGGNALRPALLGRAAGHHPGAVLRGRKFQPEHDV